MRLLARALGVTAVASLMILAAGCGYHMAETATRIPPDVKVIAIPTFVNKSPEFKIEQRITAAVMREFIQRTDFQVTPNPKGADAEIKGTVNSVRTGAITFDPNTGRATTFQIQVNSSVELIDLHTKKVLFSNPNYIFRDEYQVSESTPALFQEDVPAMNRLSNDFAQTLVTDILENF
ncbi:MAG: LPS assembly lipoprotein LptE [Acidobacteria bacterium]|nr:LPS assembly lipoprotein LptE [Acidobacteriota bacterium]